MHTRDIHVHAKLITRNDNVYIIIISEMLLKGILYTLRFKIENSPSRLLLVNYSVIVISFLNFFIEFVLDQNMMWRKSKINRFSIQA